MKPASFYRPATPNHNWNNPNPANPTLETATSACATRSPELRAKSKSSTIKIVVPINAP
jgi:hypothetical protein